MNEFEAALPECFHNTIQKTVVIMKEMKKKVKMVDVVVYNTEVIYSRVMCLLNVKQIDLKDLFKYELSPVQLSLFDENGDSRLAKQKDDLENTLKEEVSLRTCLSENAVVLNGCAFLWSVHWPKAGNVSNLVNVFKDYVMKFLHKSNVFLIFDWHHDYSIKGVTRQDRVGNARRLHKLSLSTPLPSKEVTLHSTEKKKQLIELLAERLVKSYTNAPCEKKLVITSQSECPVQVHLGIKTLSHGMSTTHEETDVIIPQQAINTIEERATCVKVISDDTDVFVSLLHFCIEQSLSTTVFLEGTGSNRNVIDIGKTAEKQKDVVPSLLAAHVLSGCNSVPMLYGLGKKSVFCLLQKYPLQHLGYI